MKRVPALLFLNFILFIPAPASGALTLPQGEKKLQVLFDRLAGSRDDQEKKRLADSINFQLVEVLSLPGAFDYSFSQLYRLGKVNSSNGRIRIYSWNLPHNDGTNTYFGYLHCKSENKKETRLFTLSDRSTEIPDPDKSVLTPDHWYGMLIYEIVEKTSGNNVYYTLLGYDNENLFLSRKIADVLYFDDKHEPVFGKAIFHYHDKYLCRVLFEYSAKVQMSLKWNAKLKMIVFDHLSPLNSSYTGNHQYYGPDLSFDAFKFENGIWELVENVDVRNL